MKFFAVVPTLLAVCAAEAQLPIAAQYLGAAGLYQGYSGLTAGAYASPYAAYGPAAVDAKFAYGAPITALNAGPLTAAPVATSAPVATYTATAPLPTATYAAAYTTAPVAVAAPAVAAVHAVPAVAAAPIAGPVSSQFQAQDEYGNVAYGYQNINSAKEERGNANGGVTGSYTYQDEAGVHTVNYIADAFGFRVASDNLPIAPVFNGVAPAAPVYTGVAPLPVADTAEVAAAKAEFFKAFNAAKKTKRSADAQLAYGAYGGLYNGAFGYGLPAAYGYNAAAFAPATYAAAPIAPLAAAPVATYAAAPLAAVAPAAYAAAPLAAVAPAAYAASAPALAAAAPAAPAREAVLTTIKLNPGHATFYRVD